MCPWLVDENLGRLFRARSKNVLQAMDRSGHAGRLPKVMTGPRAHFLAAAYRRLVKGMADPATQTPLRAWVRELKRAGPPPYEFDDTRRTLWLSRVGLWDIDPNEQVELEQHHLYAYAQWQAADPSLWGNPAAGIVHSAVQLGFASELEWAGGKKEPTFTDALVARIGKEAAELLDSINMSPTDLPPGMFLHFLTVNMQTSRDELDSDLAIVVGLRIEGRPVYRVCLLQAKWRPDHGGKIGVRGGRQLTGLRGTGMGFYLFYPASSPEKYDRFRFASVVSAEDVFQDVWGLGEPPRFQSVDTLGSPFGNAWDLPTFVSRLLDPMVSGAWLTFDTLDEVKEALRGERVLPLTQRRLVAFDTTENDMLVATLESLYDPGPDEPEPDKPQPFITKRRLKPPPAHDLDNDPEDEPEGAEEELRFRRQRGWNPFG
ncbi:hypothetical protein [Aureimonas phyllosphaerae]|uniref:Uncharacterized protein n=1 Tax=Aureimonas phyllosphaerae TaxID=1166078 RepID=A0A7W6BWJ9_9HYPH|nr:hypothetical protein [Aureimonas phyllosphaerae]MBB3937374.1 hypothetical protein [Aureimonas phyllosphaerae]MBB3961381.1 hypothetical protein [Aureimonas phyllosphaerae]SFF42418.1 hypothetical protein SAMN05216566_11291 [Aureimonas phyllosphaerae]